MSRLNAATGLDHPSRSSLQTDRGRWVPNDRVEIKTASPPAPAADGFRKGSTHPCMGLWKSRGNHRSDLL
jgi:hypothetical protein